MSAGTCERRATLPAAKIPSQVGTFIYFQRLTALGLTHGWLDAHCRIRLEACSTRLLRPCDGFWGQNPSLTCAVKLSKLETGLDTIDGTVTSCIELFEKHG
jgi:hypothetical protein